MSLRLLRAAIAGAAERLAAEAVTVADRIWEYAEQPFQEFRSSALIREVLSRHGFVVKQEFSKIPTAFAMSAGGGGPRIGILAEYDALPDCGLDEGTWGHGCGHHLLGAGSLLAALVARDVMRSRRPRGTIVLYGCPAEETLAGKVYMARDGAFGDLDAALAWHPGGHIRVEAGGGAALNTYAFEFFGKTAHGASAHHGRSALDAVELMDHAVNILREHIPENVRIHSVITCGGSAPNVVPEYARSWLFVRGQDRKQVEEISARVLRCARGAAVATETRSKATLLTAVYERLPNDRLAEHLHTCLKQMGPPAFDDRDRRALRRVLLKAAGRDKKAKVELPTKIEEIDKNRGRASSDQDNVSWLAPLAALQMACSPKGITGHHRDTTRVGRSSAAHKGTIQAGKVLALAAVSLAGDPNLRARVRREFRRRTKDFTYDPVIPRRQLPPIGDRIPAAPPAPPQ